MKLTQKAVCDALEYNPKTGFLTWKITTRGAREGNRAGWYDRFHGYRGIMVLGKRYPEHRVIWFMVHGRWPKSIDHVNGDGMDNRLANLRECTQRQNIQNLAIHRAGRLVGARRCRDAKRTKPWLAMIRNPGGGHRYLGHYRTEKEAHEAYVKAAREYGRVF